MNERTNEHTRTIFVWRTNIILLIDVHTFSLPISCHIQSLYYVVSGRPRARMRTRTSVRAKLHADACVPESMPFHEFVFVILKYQFKVKENSPVHFQLEVLPCNGTVFVTHTKKEKINKKNYSFTSLQWALCCALYTDCSLFTVRSVRSRVAFALYECLHIVKVECVYNACALAMHFYVRLHGSMFFLFSPLSESSSIKHVHTKHHNCVFIVSKWTAGEREEKTTHSEPFMHI